MDIRKHLQQRLVKAVSRYDQNEAYASEIMENLEYDACAEIEEMIEDMVASEGITNLVGVLARIGACAVVMREYLDYEV